MNHPNRDAWEQAGRRLLLKAVEEFAYEELLVPVPDTDPVPDAGAAGRYRLDLGEDVHWTLRAARGTFGTWRVEPGSLLRHPDVPDGQEAGPERLLLDARRVLGWDGATTAEVLRELTATRRADAEAIVRALPVPRWPIWTIWSWRRTRTGIPACSSTRAASVSPRPTPPPTRPNQPPP